MRIIIVYRLICVTILSVLLKVAYVDESKKGNEVFWGFWGFLVTGRKAIWSGKLGLWLFSDHFLYNREMLAA